MFIIKNPNTLNYYTYTTNGFAYTSPSSYDKFDDAVAAAKKEAKRTKEDVEIWSKTHVVQFPDPQLEVVALVEKTA